VQLLLGHSNISMTQRYLGVEMDDAVLLVQRNQI
jgi:site-specific recombinase XerD